MYFSGLLEAEQLREDVFIFNKKELLDIDQVDLQAGCVMVLHQGLFARRGSNRYDPEAVSCVGRSNSCLTAVVNFV